MDANIKYTISNEDLLGVLRTILLFLENLGFKNTCDALQNECLRKGYDIAKSDPAKLVMISSPEVGQKKDCVDSCNTGKSDKCTCTDTSPTSNQKNKKKVTCKKCQHSQTLSSPNNFENFENCQKLYNDDYIPPATMESEQPTKIISKGNLNKINKNLENENKLVYKSQSTPSMKTYDSFVISVEDEESEENIEKYKDYRQLQNDSEKLLGTVTQSSQTIFTNDAETNHPIEIHSICTIDNKNNKRIVSTTSIIKNANPNNYNGDNFPKDKSVVFNVSNQIDPSLTKIVTETSREPPKSATSIYEENIKKEREAKDHKCATCNELPNIFVYEDGVANQSNVKNSSTDLDFKKIKKDLCSRDENLKLQLVQALRWRITQNDSTTRYQVMGSYTRHDLLMLSFHSTPEEKSLPELYLCPDSTTPNPLQEQMARLLNTFASLTFGRDYLCHDGVVSLLVSLIIDNQTLKVKIDSKTRDMLIATLQKLSLRNQQRMLMISSGLLEYLVSYLRANHNSLSKYCMEYSTALFMNLCLHKQARDRLVPSAKEVIGLLSDLLDNKYDYCMPYVNGAIYSLLLNPHINKEAQRLKLDKLIDYHIQNTEGEMHRQLQVILKLHKNEKAEDDCDCDPSVEPEEEGDYLEPELDSEDTLKLQPSGDDFLEKYKILFSVFGSQVYAVRLKCMCLATGSCRPRSQPLQQKAKSDKNIQKDSQMIQTLNKSNGIRNNQKNFRSMETLSKSSGVNNDLNELKSENLENVSTATTTKYATENKEKEKSDSAKNNQKDSQTIQTLNKSNGVRNNQKNFQSTETLSKSSGVKNDLNELTSKNLEDVSTATTTKYVTENETKELNTQTASDLTSLEMHFNEENQDLDPVPPSKTEIVECKQDQSKPKIPDISQKQNSRQEIFSKVPSLQTRMLNSKRYQNLYNPPPSFTRTIPMQLKPLMKCVDPCLTYCYKQGMSRSGLDDNRNFTCYRESYDNSMVKNFVPSNAHQCKPDCVCCNTRKKYSCNCYNAIRKSINIDDTHLKKTVKSDLTKSAPSNCHCTCITPQSPTPMKVLVSTPKESDPPITPTTQRTQQNSSSGVDFSYNELLCNLCPETIFHVCPNSKVNYHCYDDVFLSRPRILRTPP